MEDWKRAQEPQRQLLAACGWPKNCRKVYRHELAEALQWQRYCKLLVDQPDLGHSGTNSDPASRRRKLKEAQEAVAYRKKLLAGLDDKVAK